jgi:hypothetical protein
VIIAASVAMALDYLVECTVYDACDDYPTLIHCLFFYFRLFHYKDDPVWIFPNQPLWYVGALFWSWIFFPFFTPLFRWLSKPFCGYRGWPLFLVILAMAFAAYLPVLSLIGTTYTEYETTYHRNSTTHKKYATTTTIKHAGTICVSGNCEYSNILMLAPWAQMPAFLCGVAAGALTKIMKPALTKALASLTADASPVKRYGTTIAMTAVVDFMMACLVWLNFRATADDDAENYDYLQVVVYHSATLPVTLYFLLSTASGGYGLSTYLFRCEQLVSLGRYSLYVYVFQEPFVEYYYWYFTRDDSGDHHLEGNLFFTYVICLWIVSAIYGEYIETPALEVVYKLPGMITGLLRPGGEKSE